MLGALWRSPQVVEELRDLGACPSNHNRNEKILYSRFGPTKAALKKNRRGPLRESNLARDAARSDYADRLQLSMRPELTGFGGVAGTGLAIGATVLRACGSSHSGQNAGSVPIMTVYPGDGGQIA